MIDEIEGRSGIVKNGFAFFYVDVYFGLSNH